MVNELAQYIGCTKALSTWIHAAHHVAKGKGFIGDHENLYGKMYEEIIDDFDKLIEKSIVLTDSEEIACPVTITKNSFPFLTKFQSPANQDSDIIAITALDFMRHHVDHLTSVYHIMDRAGALTLGMDDYLAAAANQYEEYIYLLGQRVKSGRMY